MDVVRMVAAVAFGAFVAEVARRFLASDTGALPQPLFTGVPVSDATSAPRQQAVNTVSHELELDVFARTVWGEARGETDQVKIGVASVIRNRVLSPGFPKTFADVCLQKEPGHLNAYEFSAWNASDPNRAKMLAVTTADPVFVRCLQICTDVMAGNVADPTGGATFYENTSLGGAGFFSRLEKTAQLGRLTFYREQGIA